MSKTKTTILVKEHASVSSELKEVWKTIRGFSSYQISNFGNIRSLERVLVNKNGHSIHKKSKVKKLRTHPKNGFVLTDLIDDNGFRKTVYPHKEVAIAFLSKPKNKKHHLVIHLDGKLDNNHFSNLQWATASESAKLSFEKGRRDNSDLWSKRKAKFGESGGNTGTGRKSPLNYNQKKELVQLRQEKNYTYQQLAKKFGCSVSFVGTVLKEFKNA